MNNKYRIHGCGQFVQHSLIWRPRQFDPVKTGAAPASVRINPTSDGYIWTDVWILCCAGCLKYQSHQKIFLRAAFCDLLPTKHARQMPPAAYFTTINSNSTGSKYLFRNFVCWFCESHTREVPAHSEYRKIVNFLCSNAPVSIGFGNDI